MGGGEGKRSIKLVCPSVSKIVELVAWDEQRLDFGCIARAFGLEPSSLKLNGHFISRGVDLIASSVTWKSLLSFFSSRGFSTGATDSDALIVDGKLSKLGSKRQHDPADLGNGTLVTKQHVIGGPNESSQLGQSGLMSNKRVKGGSAGLFNRIDQISGSNLSSLKRKLLPGDSNPLKRTRVNETKSGLQEKNVDISKTFVNHQSYCSIVDDITKRMKEDDLIVAAPFSRSPRKECRHFQNVC